MLEWNFLEYNTAYRGLDGGGGGATEGKKKVKPFDLHPSERVDLFGQGFDESKMPDL